MTKSKNQIARSMYSTAFEDLYGGQKAAVTKKWKAQNTPAVVSTGNSVVAEIGRVGVNGTKKCILDAGSIVEDLIEQANYTIDTKKETVKKRSTGDSVPLSRIVEDGEIYIIAPEIKSA